jgi:hypothetical protein
MLLMYKVHVSNKVAFLPSVLFIIGAFYII